MILKRHVVAAAVLWSVAGYASANCPAVTVADSKGVPAGAYPQQYELAESDVTSFGSLEYARVTEKFDQIRTYFSGDGVRKTA